MPHNLEQGIRHCIAVSLRNEWIEKKGFLWHKVAAWMVGILCQEVRASYASHYRHHPGVGRTVA